MVIYKEIIYVYTTNMILLIWWQFLNITKLYNFSESEDKKAPDKQEREEDREQGWESDEMDAIAIYRYWRQKEEGTVMKRYVYQSKFLVEFMPWCPKIIANSTTVWNILINVY